VRRLKKMGIYSQKNKDLEEISLHIQELKQQQEIFKERKDETVNQIEIISKSTGQFAENLNLENIQPKDVSGKIGYADESFQNEKETEIEKVTTMQTEPNSVVICDMCKTPMLFEKNLGGLVIHSKFFACEKCCQEASKNDLENWTESRIAKTNDVEIIGLWLMEKENRTKLIV
jgi:hypothetical protein